jgi:hypothetical protein
MVDMNDTSAPRRTEDILKKLREMAQLLHASPIEEVEVIKPTTPPPRTYFFGSFDLVNATQFKSQHPERWQKTIWEFYQNVKAALKKDLHSEAVIWKFAGDEVLFWISPTEKRELCNCVLETYNVLQQLDKRIRSETDDLLRVKGACWAALSCRPEAGKFSETAESDTENSAPNLVVTLGADEQAPSLDFVGPDIDTGFRVSTCTFKSVLTVSAELAAFLMRNAEIPMYEMLHLVGYRSLKGIWNGRPYPVVWFGNFINHVFEYDDYLASEFLDNWRRERFEIKSLCDVVMAVRKNAVNQLETGLIKGPKATPTPLELRVHCVAVCVNWEGKVMMVLRPENKPVLPGKWDFGCAESRVGERFEDTLRRVYSENFGLEIVFDTSPICLGIFSFTRPANPNIHIPGVKLLATVHAPPPGGTKAFSREIRWVDPENIDQDILNSMVPDGAEVLRRVAAELKK